MLREAPYITISELTFSDETTIELHSNDIVVFVGPNNAGKSASLREIQSMLGRGGQKTQVITNIKPTKSGTIDELMDAFERYGHKSFLGSKPIDSIDLRSQIRFKASNQRVGGFDGSSVSAVG